jgi:hypothetical protein
VEPEPSNAISKKPEFRGSGFQFPEPMAGAPGFWKLETGNWKPGLVFFLLIAGYWVWIVSLPVFPSQDGPVHLYYAEVASRLFSGSAAFGAEYRLAHWLPPYSLHYYILMLLLRWVPAPLAEKLLVCIAVLVSGYGLRFLAGRIGPSGSVVSIWMLPFVLHRYIFLGLYNYGLALGLAFFAMGVWCSPNRHDLRQRALFLVLTGVITLTHPVPLAILLGYCGTLLICGAFSGKGEAQEWVRPRTSRGDWIVLLAASASVIYVVWFRNPLEVHPDQVPVGSVQGLHLHFARFRELVEMFLVSPIVSAPYRGLLAGIALLASIGGLVASVRDLAKRHCTIAVLTAAWGLMLAAGVAFLPTWINGAALFAERLSVPGGLLLVAAASRLEWPRKHWIAIVAGAVVAASALLALQSAIGPAARRLALPQRSSVAAPYGRAIFVSTLNTPVGLTFDPCRSAGVRLIQQDEGVWVNPPWLGSPQLMLGRSRTAAPAAERLNNDPSLSVVIGHCGGPDAGLTASLMERYPGRWTVTRYLWANVLYPIRR